MGSLQFWRALIEGPPGSPFEGGVFALNVVVPDNYPFQAPRISFETPIYHCNVNDSGKICLSLIQEDWNPALSIPKSLEAIRMMMKNPYGQFVETVDCRCYDCLLQACGNRN